MPPSPSEIVAAQQSLENAIKKHGPDAPQTQLLQASLSRLLAETSLANRAAAFRAAGKLFRAASDTHTFIPDEQLDRLASKHGAKLSWLNRRRSR